MIPTLRPGELLWSRRPAGDLPRGAVVLIRLARSPAGLYLKRLVGLPGERLALEDAAISIGDTLLSEPYVLPTARLQPQPVQQVTLDSDSYFVLGDARDDSLDSRRFGPVKRAELVGWVTHRFWPLARYGRL